MTWEPENATGAAAALVPADLALGSGASIPAWTDRVAMHSFAQGTGAKQPTYAPTGINGAPALRFSGAQLLRFNGNLTTANTGHVFALVKFNTFPSLAVAWSSADEATTGSGGSGLRGHISSTNTPRMTNRHGSVQHAVAGGTVLTAGPVYLMEWASDGAAWTLRINGVAETLTTLATSNDGSWFQDAGGRDNVVVGGFKDLGGESEFFNGWIGPELFIDGLMTDDDRNEWYRWLNVHYATSLPTTIASTGVEIDVRPGPVIFPVPVLVGVSPFSRVTFDSIEVEVHPPGPTFLPVEVGVGVGPAARQSRLSLGNVARRAIQGGLRLVDNGAVFTDRVTIELADPDGPGLIEGSVPESFGRDFLDELSGPGSFGFKLRNEVLDQSAPDPYAVPMIANPSRAFARRKKVARFSIDGEPVFQGFIEHETEHKVAKGGADRFTLLTGRGLDALWGHCTVMPTNVAMRGGLLTGNVPIQYQRRFCYIDPRYEPNGWQRCVSVARQDFAKPPTQRWVGNPPGWTDPIAFWVAPEGTHVDPDTGQVGIWYLRVEEDIAFDTPDQTDDCTLYYAADDAAVIFLDGVKLATSVGWEQLQKVPIPGMTSGTHVLAAQITNAATVTGLIYTLIRDSTNEILFRSAEQTPAGKFPLVLPFPDHEPGMTVGQVLEILLGEAQFLRGMAGAMQLGFDAFADSAGNPWPVVSDITLNVGDTYDKVMAYLGESYCDYRWRPSGWTLDAYVPGTMRKTVAVGYQSGVDEDTDNLTTLDRETLNEVANVLTVQWNHGVFIIEADGLSPSDRIEGFVKFDVDTLDEALVLGRATLALTSTAPSSLTASVVARSNDDTFYVNGTLVGDDVPLDGDTERLVALRVAQQDGGSKLLTFTPEFKSKWQEREDRLQTYINRIIPGGVGGVSQLPSDATDEVPGDEIVKTRTYAFTFGDGSPDTRGPLPADVSGHIRQVMIRRDGNLGTTTATVKINGKTINEELDGQPDPFDPDHNRVTIPTIQLLETQTLAKLTVYPPVPIHPFTDEYSVELNVGNNTRTIVTVILEMKPIL